MFRKTFVRVLVVAVLGVCVALGSFLTEKDFAQSINEADPSASPPAEDLWTAGETVEIKQDGVNGDAAVAGANVKISGKVRGYLMMAAGANVSIDAPVDNDLWAAGANLSVDAPIADNAMLAGSSVLLLSSAVVGKDARVAGGNVDIQGRVTRNLYVAAANARISSEIGGNVTAHTERLTLDPGAIIRGDLIVYSPNEPVISPQSQVLGRVDYHPTRESGDSVASQITGALLQTFLKFLWLSVLGLLAIWVSTVWTHRVSEMLKQKPAQSLLVGIIAVIVAPILLVLLLVTVIGLPLALILGAASLVFFLLSAAFVSYFVGEWVLNKAGRWQDSNVAKVLVGALIVSVAVSLPFVGWLAKLAVTFFGVGAFALERRDLITRLRAEGLA